MQGFFLWGGMIRACIFSLYLNLWIIVLATNDEYDGDGGRREG